MALPSDLYTVAVTASFKDAGGAALPGTVTFTLSALLADGTGNVVIPAYPKPYTLSAGSLTAGPLVANDNADLLPANSTYLVTVALQNMQQYSYSVQLLAAPFSFTATNATPAVFTAAGSSYANGTAVTLTGGSLPAGFTAATTYYVVSASGTSFSLAATSGGSAIASTGTGSGTVSTASVDLADLQPVVSQGTPVSYVPTSGGTYTGTVVLDGSPALQIPSGAAAGQVLTSDGSGNGVWAAPALVVKPEVQEATAAALPANAYASGVLTASSNGALTVDGIAVTAGDRVLVKNEVTAANNGVYVATSAGASGAKYVLTRSADMSIAADIPGAFIFVQQGTNNGNTGWMVTGAGPWTLGSTAITWAQFSAVPAIGLLTPTATKTANYTAVSGDMVKTDTSGGSFTVTLPSAPAVNTTIGVKQVTVAGVGTNATTIACGGSDVLNKSGGPVSMTLDRQNQTVIMQYGSGGIWTVQATDPATGQIATARQGVWYLDTFTGTDDAKFASALAAVIANGGGTIALSPRSHTFANQWATTFNSLAVTPIRIAGAGGASSIDAQTQLASGVTTVNMSYSSTGARMSWLHQGLIELSGILFKDSGGSSAPFFQTIYSTPRIHDCTFEGSATGSSCFQDAILLGGTDNSHGFQGYGGIIRDNHFSGIRRVVTFQYAANAVMVRDNMISASCGDPAKFGAPFVIAGGVTLTVNGAHIADNLIEMDSYQAAVNATNGYAINCLIGPNTLWDSPGSVYCVLDSTSSGNVVDDRIYGAYTDSPIYGISPNSGNLLSRGSNPSYYSNPQYYFTNLRARGFSFISEDSFGNGTYLQPFSTGSNPYVPGCQVVATAGKIVTDGNVVSGSKYVTSATAAFAASTDAGAPIRSFGSTGTIVGTIERVLSPTSWLLVWTASTAVILGDLAIPASSNAHLYQCTTAGTTGSSQPTFPTGGGTVTDGTAVWTDLGTGLTAARVSIAASVSGTGTNLYWARTGGANTSMTTFFNHHVLGSGTTPTWTPNANAGSGATCSVVGKDLGHVLTLTTGTGPASGIQATGAAGQTLTSISGACVIQAANAAAATLMTTTGNGVFVTATVGGSSTAWTLTSSTALTASTAYKFSVVTIG